MPRTCSQKSKVGFLGPRDRLDQETWIDLGPGGSGWSVERGVEVESTVKQVELERPERETSIAHHISIYIYIILYIPAS